MKTEHFAHATIQAEAKNLFMSSVSMLQASETPLAKLPELSPAQFGLGSTTDQLPVGASDESAPEALPASTHCTIGEAHSYQQTGLQLVSGGRTRGGDHWWFGPSSLLSLAFLSLFNCTLCGMPFNLCTPPSQYANEVCNFSFHPLSSNGCPLLQFAKVKYDNHKII